MEIYMDDSRLRRWRTARLLGIGIGLAAAVALGVDETRLVTAQAMFPFQDLFKGLLWWLLMCHLPPTAYETSGGGMVG